MRRSTRSTFALRQGMAMRLGLALVLTLGTSLAQARAPEVLVTIKPLQLIATAIAGDQLVINRLLAPTASPHQYQLKPSEARKLIEADAIIWVGPELETFLSQVIRNNSTKPTLALTQRPHIEKLLVTSDASEAHNHPAHSQHEQDHGHDHAEIDAHIWLSPKLALAAAREMASLFGELVPAQRQLFQQRLQQFESALARTDAANQKLLQPLKSKGFLVTHDGYGHFVRHYGLNQTGALTLNPERQPGARHIAELRQMLLAKKTRCILVEPQFRPKYLPVLTEGIDVRTQEVDPMGGDIHVNAQSYFLFLEGLATNFARCLTN